MIISVEVFTATITFIAVLIGIIVKIHRDDIKENRHDIKQIKRDLSELHIKQELQLDAMGYDPVKIKRALVEHQEELEELKTNGRSTIGRCIKPEELKKDYG